MSIHATSPLAGIQALSRDGLEALILDAVARLGGAANATFICRFLGIEVADPVRGTQSIAQMLYQIYNTSRCLLDKEITTKNHVGPKNRYLLTKKGKAFVSSSHPVPSSRELIKIVPDAPKPQTRNDALKDMLQEMLLLQDANTKANVSITALELNIAARDKQIAQLSESLRLAENRIPSLEVVIGNQKTEIENQRASFKQLNDDLELAAMEIEDLKKLAPVEEYVTEEEAAIIASFTRRLGK